MSIDPQVLDPNAAFESYRLLGSGWFPEAQSSVIAPYAFFTGSWEIKREKNYKQGLN